MRGILSLRVLLICLAALLSPAASQEKKRIYTLPEVSAADFEAKVLDEENDVVIQVYNPANDNDFKLAPRLTALANKLRYVEGLYFYKFDVSKAKLADVISEKCMNHIKKNALADFTDPENGNPKILLFGTLDRDDPAIFNGVDDSEVNVETMMNFLVNYKMWDDEDMEMVEKGFGMPLNQIIVRAMDPLKDDSDLFTVIDKNNNGKIDITELAVWLDEPYGSKKLQTMFDADDKDGDGYVTWDEFSGPKGATDHIALTPSPGVKQGARQEL